MQQQRIDSDEFIAKVRPALEQRDADELAATVKSHWSVSELCELLRTGSLDARRVVCLTLGLVGCDGCSQCLASVLKDEDPTLAELAEHAMWSIWFRSGSPESMGFFKRGLEVMDRDDHAAAVEAFGRAIAADPAFAEAYNQRSIAHYMLEDWPRSLADCQRALNLMPHHFGAWAGKGHCHAQMGELNEAAECYRRALSINPRMQAIAGALARLDERLRAPV